MSTAIIRSLLLKSERFLLLVSFRETQHHTLVFLFFVVNFTLKDWYFCDKLNSVIMRIKLEEARGAGSLGTLQRATTFQTSETKF